VSNDEDRPTGASFFDDPATADLAAKVAEAWTEFGRALADALPLLPAGSRLDLTLDPAASGVGDAVFGVSVLPSGESELRAYAVGNALLPPEHRLSRAAVGDLVALGWSPPGVIAGADDRFGLVLSTAQANRLAAILGRTLRDVYGTPHPAFLMYAVHSRADAGGPSDTDTDADAGAPSDTDADAGAPGDAEARAPRPIELPPLGAARPMPEDSAPALPGTLDLAAMPLPDKVAAVIAAMLKTTPENLPVDKDGDIGIRSGSAMVFVRVRDNPPLIDVFSPVLTEVDASEQLYVRLSELTHRMPIGRLYCAGETVWASVPVFGRDFQPTHLMLAVQVMTGLADELDDRLHGEFGGKRFFAEGDRPGIDADPSDRTGMYL
jgi:hypothetical protein